MMEKTIEPLAPGDEVIWFHEPRGGYGFEDAVPGVVVAVSAQRVRILVQRRDGSSVERSVTRARVIRRGPSGLARSPRWPTT